MLTPRMLPLMLLLAGLVPVSGTAAAQVRNIDVVNNAYVARAVVANAGDTIRWNVRGNGHTVTAYAGADFDSGMLNLNAGQTYEVAYGGGTILYRCRNHSSLSGPSACEGMCGKLTDVPPQDLPSAPTVAFPTHNSTTDNRAVNFSGGVTGNAVKVYMYEGNTQLGPGSDISGGGWQQGWLFDNGTHHIHFVAEHPEGYRSLAGPARTVPNPSGPGTITERFITIHVASSDSEPPTVALDQPRDVWSRSPLQIAGRAFDDVAVGSVEVIVRDQVLGFERRPKVTCTECGSNSPAFFASQALDPGLYRITVRAFDLTNKVGEATRDVVVLV